MSEASSEYLPRYFAVRQISTSTSVNTGCYLTSITQFPDLPQIWGNLRSTAVCIWRHGIPLVKFYNCCKVLGRRRLTCNLRYEFLDSSMPVEIIKRNNASFCAIVGPSLPVESGCSEITITKWCDEVTYRSSNGTMIRLIGIREYLSNDLIAHLPVPVRF